MADTFAIPKKYFIKDWASDFITQTIMNFDLKIKDFKNIDFKSDNEKKFYFSSSGTYQDIYFLYFIDYIEQIITAHEYNSMPRKISDYPIYIEFAFAFSLEKIEYFEEYNSILEISKWIHRIMYSNHKYLESTKSSEMLVSKYSISLSNYISENMGKIKKFFNDFNTVGEISVQALNGINGISNLLLQMKNDDVCIQLRDEKNILIDVHSRMMIPLMNGNVKKINNLTPTRIGSVINYTRTSTRAQTEASVSINQSQVIASIFQKYPTRVQKDAISSLFFKEIAIFTNSEIATMREKTAIEEKANILSTAILLNDYKKHFNEIKPTIEEAIDIYILNNKKGNILEAELLYDISQIIKKELGAIVTYKDLINYDESISNFLKQEIFNLIKKTIQQKR